jgi:predicted RNase H-like nuclease
MRAILGLDAAWTEGQPTGVALIEEAGSGWRVSAVAPSYDTFIRLARGLAVDWNEPRFDGSWPNTRDILDAARALSPATVSVVALDMPIASVPIESRRAADRAISRAFGSRGCSTHSPTATRPGPLGVGLMSQLDEAGFPIATCVPGHLGRTPSTIEVYPHPALLTLRSCDYRVPYKVSRSRKYWPGASVELRISRLLDEFAGIRDALQRELGPLPFDLPAASETPTLARLKRYEDALDAVVCAWVGLRFLQRRARCHGDETAAVWVPPPPNE